MFLAEMPEGISSVDGVINLHFTALIGARES
jgi:hypothetical protein